MKKSLTLLIALFWIGLPAWAQTLSRNETVYITLNAEGAPLTTEVVTWLRTDGKRPSIDLSDATSVRNVKSSDTPIIVNDQVIFNAPARDIFYSGVTDMEPPISVSIAYLLDNQPIELKELEGKSGKLQMTILLKNMTKSAQEVSYKEVGTHAQKTAQEEISTPFIVRVETDLNIDQFNNVEAPAGAFAVIGQTIKMNWIVFPYPEERVTLTAEISQVKMPPIMFIVIPKMPPLPVIDIESKLNEIYNGVDQVGNYLVRLKKGANDLNGGQKQMLTALSQVNEGTKQLIQASNAQVEIANGAIKINEGMTDKIAPLAKIPIVSKEADKALHYMSIQKELLELATKGGPFSEEILAFFKEQGKKAPPVKEFPGIKVTTEGITKLNKGSLEMIAGAQKLDAGSAELASYLGQVKREGTDEIKKGIRTSADPLVRKLAGVKCAEELARSYDRFTGRPSEVKSSVGFVMKSPGS